VSATMPSPGRLGSARHEARAATLGSWAFLAF
jgi:hypothetical protein